MDGQPEAMDWEGDPEIITLLNSGKESDRKEGLARLNEDYRDVTCGFIRCRSPSISEFDLAELWSDVLISIWEMAEAREIGPDPPLRTLLRVIAARRRADYYRRLCAKRQLPLRTDIDLVRIVDPKIHETTWEGDLAALFAAWLASLSGRELLVVVIMVESMESGSGKQPGLDKYFTLTAEEVADAMSNKFGITLSRRTATRLRACARRKLVEIMN